MKAMDCVLAALSLLGETAQSGEYYINFALSSLNQVLAGSLCEINAERAAEQQPTLLAPPVLNSLEEDLPVSEWMARDCFSYGLAALLVADEDKEKFNWAADEYATRLLRHCPAELTAVREMI